jgi:hypothetical protein
MQSVPQDPNKTPQEQQQAIVEAMQQARESGGDPNKAAFDAARAMGASPSVVAAQIANETDDPIGVLGALMSSLPPTPASNQIFDNAYTQTSGVIGLDGNMHWMNGNVTDIATGTLVGGIVTDGSGNPITTADGTPLGWGVGVSIGYNPNDIGNALSATEQGREAASTGMVTNQAGQTVSNNLTTAAQDAANFGVVSTGGGYGSASEAANTGMTTVGGVTYSNDATIAAQDAATFGTDSVSSGGGGGGGGGKIVCTAMNEAYGFGSFRNRVWIKYARDHLSKAHEVGYHTLFLPLVDYGYRKGDGLSHRVVRSVLENIARHRGADLRAEMRGSKRDTLGRVYRAILEPLCYLVGKIKGY